MSIRLIQCEVVDEKQKYFIYLNDIATCQKQVAIFMQLYLHK